MRKTPIDHRARKQEVIAQAIRLFARLGYRDVSFRELSEECGVARTVLYRYFRDKRQIFASAISLMLARIVQKHAEIVHSKLSAAVRLRQICTVVTATLFDNRDFLCVIIDFVMSQRREGRDMSRRIMRFTIGLKRIMHTLLTWGIHHGEFVSDVKPDVVTDILYAQFESAVLRLAVSGDAVQTDVLDRIDEILKRLEKRT
ncbi:MAG: TetR/AcrR family transcriptional regulator [Kiritimatiellae bacterium]|nr:TetR/AcrR family transcriptional regulator [Kiritimatiellia bacterium]